MLEVEITCVSFFCDFEVDSDGDYELIVSDMMYEEHPYFNSFFVKEEHEVFEKIAWYLKNRRQINSPTFRF